ncbi:hypothetical protein BDQ94DRAFT_98754 [Aspergillus welwitschiae]|uniref:Secreted protein n=1 Tax=Aspergillus welwitschiae TaxID=1341132 RepID=A0A3F3PPV5_9EURO|nr:hypothetical protein BDQ94DRAFT_98754 [Aspergillus welwitschiae]RDH28346.1 hypothetical protein BDQ94DRAFT_98754 [Aspergillus welwitschiae]
MRFRFLGMLRMLSTCLMKGMDEREDFIVCFCLIQSRLSGPFCCCCCCCCCFSTCDDFVILLCLFVQNSDRAEVRISLFRVIYSFLILSLLSA